MDKSTQLRKFGIVYLVVILFVFIIIFPLLTHSEEPENNQTITKGANWNEVTNLDGSKTRTYYSGIVNYLENGTHIPINRTIDSIGCEINYDYCIDKNIYQVHYKTDPSTAQSVRYVKDGYYFTFQPHSLNYRNSLDQLEQISIVQPITGVFDENEFTYPELFGTNYDLNYTYFSTQLKEKLILQQKPSQPQEYILAQPNVTLDMDLLIDFDSNINIYIDGELWDKKTKKTTNNQVEFKNSESRLFYLSQPIAYDSNNVKIVLQYEFKKTGNSLYTVLKTNYSWLNSSDRVYPVYIDPSIEYNFSVQENITALRGEKCKASGLNLLSRTALINPCDTQDDITADAKLDTSDNNRIASLDGTAANDDGMYFIFYVTLTGIDTATITNITWEYEGYLVSSVDTQPDFYVWNETVSSYQLVTDNPLVQGQDTWVYFDSLASGWSNTDLLNGGDTTYFALADVVTNTNTDQGVYTDFVSVTVTYTEGGGDTCTYTSGEDWAIAISDNCVKSDEVFTVGNITISGDNGVFELNNVNMTCEDIKMDCTNCKFVRKNNVRVAQI